MTETVSRKRVIQAIHDLCEPGESLVNPEYHRALCNLVVRLFGGSDDENLAVAEELGFDQQIFYRRPEDE